MKPQKEQLQVVTGVLVYSIPCPGCGDHNYHTTDAKLPKVIKCEQCGENFYAIPEKSKVNYV